MSTLTEQYYQSWQTQGAVDALERFMTAHPDLNVVELVEVLLVDQAIQWQSKPGPRVEQYLERFPIVSGQLQAVLELVYGEVRAAHALGAAVDVDAYVARFPDLVDPLRRQMEVSTWLADEGGVTKPEDPPPS